MEIKPSTYASKKATVSEIEAVAKRARPAKRMNVIPRTCAGCKIAAAVCPIRRKDATHPYWRASVAQQIEAMGEGCDVELKQLRANVVLTRERYEHKHKLYCN